MKINQEIMLEAEAHAYEELEDEARASGLIENLKHELKLQLTALKKSLIHSENTDDAKIAFSQHNLALLKLNDNHLDRGLSTIYLDTVSLVEKLEAEIERIEKALSIWEDLIEKKTNEIYSQLLADQAIAA